MLIHTISISNFLCYYGSDNQFEFTEGLNIVLGANGYGKSKLYDAFQWVFSDGITDNAPRATPGGLKLTSVVKGDLVSEKAKAECAVGESVETKVVVEVESSRNESMKKYRLERTYTIRRIDEKTWTEPGKSLFQLSEFDIISFKPVPEYKHEEILERLIPVDVQPYVWFQGERGISNLIDTSSNGSLRHVIKHLSDIDRWDHYIEVTEKAYNTAKNAFDQVLKKSQKNQNQITERQTEQRKADERLAKLEELITNALINQKGAQETKDALLASIEFAKTINDRTTACDKAATNYQRATNESSAFNEGLSRKLFTDNWILLGTTTLLDRFEQKKSTYNTAVATRTALANLNRETKLQVRLPENVPERMYVQDMMDKEHCAVCNRAAPKGTEAYEAIASLLQSEPIKIQAESRRTNLEPFFKQLYARGLSLQNSIETVNQRVAESMQEQDKLSQQVRQMADELDTKKRELQEVEQLSGLTKNARDIVNSMNAAIEDITKYGQALVKHNDEKEQIEKRQRDIDDELIDLSKGQVSPQLIRKKEILFDLAELAKRVKQTKYRELVQQLEDAANEHYRNINAPTGAFYGAIRFIETGTASADRADGGYRPAIVDTDGREVGNLNTSLVSSLKLSIIMAIVSANTTRNYASFYPLISDAPVSDFDAVKTMTFFRETANTFRQSIVIVKEWLVDDSDRPSRYKPDLAQLHELRDKLDEIGKPLTVYQLDMADGVSNAHRSEIEITIQKVDC